MRKLNLKTRKAIAEREDQLVQTSQSIAQQLWKSLKDAQKRDGKVRQLRNILEVAESTDSWKALELFIRYQAARGEINKTWAEGTIQTLEELQSMANEIAKANKANPKTVHLELVTRVLGYAVRWHRWDVEDHKEKSKKQKES